MKRLLLPLALLVLQTATAQLSLQVACDIDPTGDGNPRSLTVHNGALYFYASDGTHTGELFRYTDTGLCSLVADINTNGPDIDMTSIWKEPSILSFDDKLYFTASNDTSGYELFVYDGTNVSLVADIASGPAGSNPIYLTPFNGKIYFGATDTATMPGRQLWSYDPATGIAEQAAIISLDGGSSPYELCPYNGKLYFSAYDNVYNFELRCYDPVTDSITLVADIAPAFGGWPSSLVVANDKLYFNASDYAFYGQELYEYDGTAVQRLTDIYPGPNYGVDDICYWNNALYFGGTDLNGRQLYKYDFNLDTAIVVATISGSHSRAPHRFTPFGNKLYFTAIDSTAGHENWVYDGTGVTLVEDLYTGTVGSYTYYRAVLNNKLYLSGIDSLIGNELWVLTDSTLGVKETALQNNKITLYPNPNDGSFTIHGATNAGDITGLQVINLPGSVVYASEERLHNHTINKQITLPSYLSAGTYFLKLQTTNGQQVLRFVKE